jgi:hypothetical protein
VRPRGILKSWGNCGGCVIADHADLNQFGGNGGNALNAYFLETTAEEVSVDSDDDHMSPQVDDLSSEASRAPDFRIHLVLRLHAGGDLTLHAPG